MQSERHKAKIASTYIKTLITDEKEKAKGLELSKFDIEVK
jgi:hypothetical protein